MSLKFAIYEDFGIRAHVVDYSLMVRFVLDTCLFAVFVQIMKFHQSSRAGVINTSSKVNVDAKFNEIEI